MAPIPSRQPRPTRPRIRACHLGALTIKIDTAAPSSVINHPLPGTLQRRPRGINGCGTFLVGDVCGSASDGAGPATVNVTHIALKKAGVGGLYWTGVGNAFTSAAPVWIATDAGVFWDAGVRLRQLPGERPVHAQGSRHRRGRQHYTPSSLTLHRHESASGGIYVFEGFFQPIDNSAA